MDINEAAGLGGVRAEQRLASFTSLTWPTAPSWRASTRAAPCDELAFDAAGNMVTVDNIDEWARFWSPGGYTVATTTL